MPRSSSVATKTRAITKIKTQIVVAVAAIFAMGLAAYGFGFMPFLVDQGKPSPVATTNANNPGAGGQWFGGAPSPGKQPPPAPPVGSPPPPDHEGPFTTCQLTVNTEPLVAPDNAAIVVAGADTWHVFARYRAMATIGDVMITGARVFTPTDTADFSAVALAHDGRTIAVGNLASGAVVLPDTDLSIPPADAVRIPAGASTVIEIWGKLNPVISSAAAGGRENGVARSGHNVALGMRGDYTGPGWGPAFSGRYNLRANCAPGPAPIYAVGSSSYGPPRAMFKTRPYFHSNRLSSRTLLSGGDMDIFSFQVSADAAGPVDLKKMVFRLTGSFASASTTVGSFRVRHGSTVLPSGSYQVMFNPSPSRSASTMTIIFHDAQFIPAGVAQEYTLSGIITGLVRSGDHIAIAAMEGLHPSSIGYQTEEGSASIYSGIYGPNIDTNVMADGVPDAAGEIIWSDLSELPHLDLPGTRGGSKDWIAGDTSLFSFFETQLLSR